MNKIFSSLLLIVSVVLIQLPIAVDASAAESDKPERKTQLVGPTVGKKVAKAFEAYSADDIPGALAILLDIDASKKYDKAYVSRFIAIMYAQMGNEEAKAIQYLKAAVEPDILNEGDQDQSLKLLADLQMQTKSYEEGSVIKMKSGGLAKRGYGKARR